jgi:hypothetical protein
MRSGSYSRQTQQVTTSSSTRMHESRSPLPLILSELVVRIAVQPALAGFGRCHHRVSSGTCMFGRVAVRRIVAAKCRSAFLTGAQMDPLPADLHAFGTLSPFGMFDSRDRTQVRAALIRAHRSIVPSPSMGTQPAA